MPLENLTPITRLEYYLAKIRGDEVTTPEARTRLEHYLNKIAGNTSEVIPEPKTRLEFYLAALAGADVTVPEPKTRLEEYIKGIINETGDVPDPVTRLEYYLAALAGMEIEVPEVETRLEYYLTRERKPAPSDLEYSLKFSSPTPFTLTTVNGKGNWTGSSGNKMEYYTNGEDWNEWTKGSDDAVETLTAALVEGEYVLYLRGTNNTIISSTTNATDNSFVFTGSNITCTGNIETLLDYETVKADEHPTMGSGAFRFLFYNSPLITAPSLPATTLTELCYYAIFRNCTSLTTAPELPATTLAYLCYRDMFYGCTSLTTPPSLPVTTLAQSCYQSMFTGCTALTIAPELPATTLADNCYQSMFKGCTSLTTAPSLPATILATQCYIEMFNGCTALVSAPELPATTLADRCYQSMFSNCTSLITIPLLPATTLADDCYKQMFTSCSQIKISETQTGEYQTAYRIPNTGTGVTASNALSYMFYQTGGTFTTTPEINTTYYTSNTLVPAADL